MEYLTREQVKKKGKRINEIQDFLNEYKNISSVIGINAISKDNKKYIVDTTGFFETSKFLATLNGLIETIKIELFALYTELQLDENRKRHDTTFSTVISANGIQKGNLEGNELKIQPDTTE